MQDNDIRIAVIGLGYVGLPLAVEFGKDFPVVGFDVNENRVSELQRGEDSTLECSKEELKEAVQLAYSGNTESIADCNVYIVNYEDYH